MDVRIWLEGEVLFKVVGEVGEIEISSDLSHPRTLGRIEARQWKYAIRFIA